MTMTEFTRMKIGFALALLGTLFALHPFLERYSDLGFLYMGYDLMVVQAYSLTAGLLSLCVYLYAVTLMSDRPHSRFERLGNSSYAFAILIVPIYSGLFLSAKLADRVALSHLAWAAPAVALGLGVGWVALSQLVAWQIHRRLGQQDRTARIAQLAKHEAEALHRARSLFESEHYDLSVIEAWRSLEARLRQIFLIRRIAARDATAESIIHVAAKKGILRGPALDVIAELRRHWGVAVSCDPLTREAAIESLGAVRHLLAITPVEEATPMPRPRSRPALLKRSLVEASRRGRGEKRPAPEDEARVPA